jgi:glycosyltransferase involved in cell wall biosynthesis
MSESIGIAIPFYSGVGFLAEALHSLLQQRDEAWVAVVVDDASPESGAEELVASLDDSRVGYVRNEVNLGLAANFNRCLEVTGCDVVTIFHADDLLLADYVSVVRAAAESVPAAACVAPLAVAIDGSGQRIDTMVDRMKRLLWPRGQRVLLEGDRGLARMMHGQFVYCPAIAYRPHLLPEVKFDTAWRQVMDLDLYVRLLLQGGTILLDRTPVYAYRRHAGTTTTKNAAEFVRLGEETALARRTADEAARRGWRRTRRAARIRWSIRLNGAISLMSNRTAPREMRRRGWREVTHR